MAVRDVDTSRVIEEVRKRRCLWDPTEQKYKDKEERNKAWQEIVDILSGDISEKEKLQMGKLIQQRWKTARDAFSRSKALMKNPPSGSSAKKFKRYLFYDDLLFLDPSADEIDEALKSSPPDNLVYPEFVESPENVASSEITGSAENTQYATDSTSHPWTPTRTDKRQAKQEGSQFGREWISLMATQSPDLAPDDLAFFFSLGPILRNFDLEQKMEFRTRVMREAMEMLRNPL